MKKDALKIVALLIFLISIPLIVDEDVSIPALKYTGIEIDQDWEYVKNHLFTEGDVFVKRYRDSIYLSLGDIERRDRLIVNELMSEFNKLMPDHGFRILRTGEKVPIVRIKKGDQYRPEIKLRFHKDIPEGFPGNYLDYQNHTNFGNGNYILRRGGRIDRNWELNRPGVKFYFSDSLDREKRKDLVRYEILKELCFLNKKGKQLGQTEVIFKRHKDTVGLDGFREQDEFLLQKLYSSDFLEQFKEYMYSYYPWRYASNFMSEKLTRIYAITIVTTIGIVMFILSFSLLYYRSFKFSFLDYFIPVLITYVVLLNLFVLYDYLTDVHSKWGLYKHAFFYLKLLLQYSAISSFTMWGAEKIVLRIANSLGLRLLTKISFAFVAFSAPIWLGFEDIIRLKMINSIEFFLMVIILISLIRGLLLYLKYFSDSLIKEKDVELSRLKQLNAQNELKSLHAHINPHFLYNALNSIAGLVYESPKKTEEMTISLSNLFKYSINRKGEQMSAIANEVEMVENYLKIEKVRFEERLNFTIDVEKGLLETKIPMYILQPLIENAIKHGIAKIDKEGDIVLKIEKIHEELRIMVLDNGPDFPDGLLCGHGLQSVYDLLRLSYGDAATMNWENTPEKRIVISIPLKIS